MTMQGSFKTFQKMRYTIQEYVDSSEEETNEDEDQKLQRVTVFLCWK